MNQIRIPFVPADKARRVRGLLRQAAAVVLCLVFVLALFPVHASAASASDPDDAGLEASFQLVGYEPGDKTVPGDTLRYEIKWRATRELAQVVFNAKLSTNETNVWASDGASYNIGDKSYTWTLKNLEAGASGTFIYTTKVSSTAKIDDEVLDLLKIEIYDKDISICTFIYEFETRIQIVEQPVKMVQRETKGMQWKVGDQLTYTITGSNYSDTDNTITIIDPLDPGVNYVSSEPKGTYDSKTHTVTWVIRNVAPKDKVNVFCTVTINEDATQKGLIKNKAAVQVGSFKPKDTNNVEEHVNDGSPVKSVIEPANGEHVKVGETVVFEIRGYVVGYSETIVTDTLDSRLKYVELEYESLYGDQYKGIYDEDTHTVTWKIPQQERGTPYVLHVAAEVLPTAEQDREIPNEAYAEFDNTVKKTNKVTVTVDPRTPEKTVIDPAGNKKLTGGDKITYEIKWYNTTNETATITITDELPYGTSYVSSDPVYDIRDDIKYIWVFEDQAPGAQGVVKLTLEVYDGMTEDIENYAEVKINEVPTNTNTVVTPVDSGGFEVLKNVTGEGPNRKFDFKVQLSREDINGLFGDLWFTNGVATFKLRGGESVSVSGLPVGTEYAVTETAASEYTTTVAPSSSAANTYNGTITSGGNDEITFTNTWNSGTLTISKNVMGEGSDPTKNFRFNIEFSDRTLNGTFGDVKLTGGVGTFSLADGKSVTLRGIPVGVEYEVREVQEPHYTAAVNGVDGHAADGIIEAGGTTLNYENTYTENPDNPLEPTAGAGGLTVSKTVAGEDASANVGKKFSFTVTLDDTKINGAFGQMTFANGVATFQLGNGESVTATGLPVNTEYTVTETPDPSYVTFINGEKNISAEGRVVGDETVKVEFVNTGYGDLQISKEVKGTPEDKNREFHFTVKLSDTSIQGMYGDMNFKNGVASVTLKDGQTAIAKGLIGGTTYTVTEAETNKDGFKTVAPGNTGTIQLGETAVASFTNSRVAEKKVTNVEPGVSVQPGAVLEYTIDWYNREGAVADITITDTLDENVTFVEAVDGEYNSETHTVTWNLPDREIGASGSVTLKVRVNSAAAVAGETVNQATVTVNGFEVETNPVEVPVEPTPTIVPKVPDEPDEPDEPDTPEEQKPEKTEVKPGAGVAVLPGTEIEYEITWKNNSKETADIVITDVLDAGVSYGSATVDGAYDPDTRTVTWTIPAQAAGASGSVSLTVTVNEDAVETVKNQASVQVGNEAAVQTNVVENPVQQTGGLSLTKQVTGENGDVDRVWNFVVTLDDASINGTYGEMEFAGGVASVALKHGETKTADGLPAGVGYAVEETEANQDLYSTSSENAAGTIAAGETVIVQFINQKQDQPIADIPEEDIPEADDTYILVRKVVTGSLGEKDKDFHFTVKLSDTGINGKYGEMEFVDGAAEFTLRSGEYKWGVGLPTGVTYTVSEAEADADGYVTISSGTTRELVGTGIYEVRFQNHKGDWRPEDDEPWEDLPIPEIPRTYLDQPDEPETDTPDADVPVTEDKTPKTGDVGTWEIWLVMAAGALLAAGITLSWKQKSEE